MKVEKKSLGLIPTIFVSFSNILFIVHYKMNNYLPLIIIIFWVSVWYFVEISVEDFLKYIGKNSDEYKLVAYLFLAILSFGILYYTGNLSAIF